MIKDKESTLKITTDEIEKKFGKGAIMRLGESTALNVEAIPTGALPLDVCSWHWRSTTWQDRRDLWP